MSNLADGGAQRQKFHAMYTRWNNLRMQLGPAASQNEEFVALSQTLQQIASRQRYMNQGQPQYRSNAMQGAGNEGGMNFPSESQMMGPGQMGQGQLGSASPMASQMNYMGPQMNPMGPPPMSNQMGNRMQTPLSGQMNAQMGGPHMNAMPGQVRSPISQNLNHRMSAQPQMNQVNGPISGPQMNAQMMNSKMGGPQMNPMVNPQMGGMQVDGNQQIGNISMNQLGNGSQGRNQMSGNGMGQPMNMRMNPPHGSVNPQMDPSQVRMTPGGTPQMGAGIPPAYSQQQPRRPQTRNEAQEPKRKAVKQQQPQQQTQQQAQQQAQQAQQQQQQRQQQQAAAQRKAQQSRAQLQQQQQQQQQEQQQQARSQAQRAQMNQTQPQPDPQSSFKKNEEDSQTMANNGLNWLNLDDIGEDLDIEGQGDFFKEAENAASDSFFYNDMYPQPANAEDTGFMDVFDEFQAENGMGNPQGDRSQPQPSAANVSQQGQQAPPLQQVPKAPMSRPQSSLQQHPQQPPPHHPVMRASPSEQQRPDAAASAAEQHMPMRQSVTRPMSRASQTNASKMASLSAPSAAVTPTGSSGGSPAPGTQVQMFARRTSAEHTGSLLQNSPALSHRSFNQGTPQATPIIPSRAPPSHSAASQAAAFNRTSPALQGPNRAQAPGMEGGDGERRKADQLLTPDEILIMNYQEYAFKALRNGQVIPENIRSVLFNARGPTQSLPQLSEFSSQTGRLSRNASPISASNAEQESIGMPLGRPQSRANQGSQIAQNQLLMRKQQQAQQQQQQQQHQLQQQQQQLQQQQQQQQQQQGQINQQLQRQEQQAQQQPHPQAGPRFGGALPPSVATQANGMNTHDLDAVSPRDSTKRNRMGPYLGQSPAEGPQPSGMAGMDNSDAQAKLNESRIAAANMGVQPNNVKAAADKVPPEGSAEHSSASASGNQSVYDRELPAQLAQQMPQSISQAAPQPELKKQHLEQQHMDRELSLKQLKHQQWQAQQRQEEMFRQRYATGDTDVAFVVPGGKNLNTSSRSRRLTSSSDVSDDSSPDLDMLTQLGFDRIVNPQSLVPKLATFDGLEKHDELLTIPSLFPYGVSGQLMKFERQRVISEKIGNRIAELESKKQLSVDEEIELRRLRLQPYLRAVRGDLLTHIQYFNSVAIDRSNRVHFARMKLLTQHDAALVERFVTEQALERRRSENMTQHMHLQRVNKHVSMLRDFEARRKNQRAGLAAKVIGFHQHIEREERKRYERTAKQRLQLLRANDEEAYLKLIDQTKDARITHLLKQTNKFLAGLAKAVKDQQGEEMGDIDLESEDVREKIDYYEVAHRIKEKVTEQPSMLVGGKLKDYQLKGLQWMVSLYNNHLNGILADEMGLGKTIQSISLIAYLIEVKKISGPFLVLVPLSTLTNWNMEFDIWAPSIRKIVYRGPPASRKALQPQIRSGDFQVLLTTYEYVIKERPLFSRIKWEHMIIDEGHRMKNTQSKLSSTLAQYYTSRYRLILTGTPLQNNLPELWALLNFVLPKIFNSVKSFEEWFNKPFAQAGSSDRMDLGEEEKLLIIRRLHKVLRPFLLRRLKKDVEQDLPDKVEKVIKCRKSALQSQLYRQLLDHNAFSLGAGQGGIRSLSNRVMQLRKLCNHPFVFEEVEKIVNPSGQNNDLLWRVSGKLELLDRILPKFKRAGHRTLMFFQMTQIMDIMEDFLRLRGLQYLRLDGTTKAESRSELLRLFNEPNSPYFCFLLSTRAGGLGLNLQTADTVIIYDTDWNPHQDLQAQDRAHRIGQTKEVRILRLITENSIEENILERAQGKLDIDGKVIQAGKFDNKSTNEEQEAFLRTLLEAEESKHESKEDELDELDDEELNSMLARNEDERQLFHEMDVERIASEAGQTRPRLFSEAELPEQYTTAHIDQQLSEASAREITHMDEGGHHLRARRAGNWADFENDLPPRKRSKLAEDSPSPGLPIAAVQASAPPALPKPRTGRKGRPPRVKETMTPEAREQLTDVGRRVVKRMKAVTDPDGRKRIDLFLELPSRSHYPDYYQVIGVPMCVATIVKRINSKYYQSFEQFSNDWRIIFRNARWYNAEGSIIYNDANCLEEAYEAIYRQLTGTEPPQYVDVVGDQPEKLNLQRGLPTQGTVDLSVGANLVPKKEDDIGPHAVNDVQLTNGQATVDPSNTGNEEASSEMVNTNAAVNPQIVGDHGQEAPMA